MNADKILCPVDLSASSTDMVAYASAFAAASNAELHIVYVHEEIPMETGFSGYAPMDDTQREHEELVKLKPAKNIRFTHEYLHGDPAHQIVKYADDHGIDLIVIGTHGRTGLMRALMGSVAEAVVRRASCPVVSVKFPLAEDAANETEAAGEAST